MSDNLYRMTITMKSITVMFYPKHDLVLPLSRFGILQGVFYKLLSFDPALSTAVHDAANVNERQFKYFCFSDIQGRFKIIGKDIVYSGDLTWQIRSANDYIIDVISAALMKQRKFSINHTDCYLLDLCEEQRKSMYSVKNKIVMNTPITVYETDADGYRIFYNPTQERFYTAVENNLKRKYNQYCGFELPADVLFKAVSENSFKKCVTRYSGGIIEAYYGEFLLSAPEKLIDFAYYCGLGAKNSQGFGTIR
ncbi:MAG: CRISPR-associated endoribonuclease Cas6 [Faecalibacterium sp.]|nr:CRISPR-associated endoribonuclease Cas6 [Ruminococcus sp.]MCM1392531.1 CRISPR-associated endoribonuclease Cas6 [Ruminococcus sp.]MCM1486106.1 CRISPR-associated endoribonuclease Cas6 [Faecalibacterium sp.]